VFFYERRKFAALDHRTNLFVSTAMLVRVMVLVRVCMVVVMIMVMVAVLVCVAVSAAVVAVLVLMLMLVSMAVLVRVRMLVMRMLMRMGMGMLMLSMGMLALVPMALVIVMPVLAVFAVVVGRTFAMRSWTMNIEFHSLDILPLFTVRMHVKVAEVQLSEFPFEGARLDAKVDERANHHVAADAGNAVEVE
jgi:hypothetical protein